MMPSADRNNAGQTTSCRPELVSALVDGELSPGDQLQTRRHIAVCAACRERNEDYLALRARLRAEPDIALPHSIRRKVSVRLVNGRERLGTPWRLGATAALAAGLAAIAFTAGSYFSETGSPAGAVARLNSDAATALDRLPARRSESTSGGPPSGGAPGVAVTVSGGPATGFTAPAPTTAPAGTTPEPGTRSDQPEGTDSPTEALGSAAAVMTAGGTAVETAATPAQELLRILPLVTGNGGTNPTPTPPTLLTQINPTATPAPGQPDTPTPVAFVQAPATAPTGDPTPAPAAPTAVAPPQEPGALAPPAPSPTAAPTRASTATPTQQANTPSEPVVVVRAEATATPPLAPTATPSVDPTASAGTGGLGSAATNDARPATGTPTAPTPAAVTAAAAGESLSGNSLAGTETETVIRAVCSAPTLPVFETVLGADPATEAALGCAIAPAETISIQVQAFRGGWLLDPGNPYPVYALYGTRSWGSLGRSSIPTILASGGPPILGAQLGAAWYSAGLVQEFEGGLALSGPAGYIFVLLDGGRARVY